MKRAAMLLFRDRCDIYEKTPVTREGRTEFEMTLVRENVPCRISSKTYLFGESSAGESENLASISKGVRLFVPPECEIEPGSIIRLTRHGAVETYKRAGSMTRYASHNELMIKREKDWA